MCQFTTSQLPDVTTWHRFGFPIRQLASVNVASVNVAVFTWSWSILLWSTVVIAIPVA
jgi:hypothetical protein